MHTIVKVSFKLSLIEVKVNLGLINPASGKHTSNCSTQPKHLELIQKTILKMAVKEVCKYYQYGHCKYNITCSKRHLETECEIANRTDVACEMRHPKVCRYFYTFGRCKFNPCSYRHEAPDYKIKNLEKMLQDKDLKLSEMETLPCHNKLKLQFLENRLWELENTAKELSINVQNLLKPKSCLDDKSRQIYKPNTQKFSSNCDEIISQVLPSQEIPQHKKMDEHGYPVCWQKDFKPTCCSHIHDPGRGGRNVPPDLSQCCHHHCVG